MHSLGLAGGGTVARRNCLQRDSQNPWSYFPMKTIPRLQQFASTCRWARRNVALLAAPRW